MTFQEFKELRKACGDENNVLSDEYIWEQSQHWNDDEWISEIVEEFPILANPDDTDNGSDSFTNDTSQPLSKRWPRLIKLMLEQHYKIKI